MLYDMSHPAKWAIDNFQTSIYALKRLNRSKHQ